jgi:thioredoxin reductase
MNAIQSSRGEPSREVDVLVVGGGPSGLSAASWAARYRHSVVLVDSGEHRADAVQVSHGYLGRDPQSPQDLLRTGRRELLAYPNASLCEDTVLQVQPRPDGTFAVILAEGSSLVAQRIVLACGVRDLFPDIEGFAEHYGASAFHCPSCDGYEVRDQDVVCVGWNDHLVGFCTQVLGWARSVTLVTDGRSFEGSVRPLMRHGIELVEDAATALIGERGALRGVRLGSGRVLPAAALFFSIGHVPRSELAEALGCTLDEEGFVRVNDCGMTSVAGVYACGDLTPGLQLTSVAAAKGVVAGIGAAQSLLETAG